MVLNSPHGAKTVDVAGLSLNLRCQQYPGKKLSGLVEGGTRVRCLFCEPRGTATKAREWEGGFAEGNLAGLTELNIQTLLKVRERLSPETQERLQIATYDETVRFNVTIVDNRRCVVQPYSPGARGVDSPTFLIERNHTGSGLFPAFSQVFAALGRRGRRR